MNQPDPCDRPWLQVPDEDCVAGWIAGALRRHGLGAAHVVAHSYGTFMASRLVQLQPRPGFWFMRFELA